MRSYTCKLGDDDNAIKEINYRLKSVCQMRDEFIDKYRKLAALIMIMLITGDLGFGVLTDFADRFQINYCAGVAEQNMTALWFSARRS